jgi:hypothetical protein
MPVALSCGKGLIKVSEALKNLISVRTDVFEKLLELIKLMDCNTSANKI